MTKNKNRAGGVLDNRNFTLIANTPTPSGTVYPQKSTKTRETMEYYRSAPNKLDKTNRRRALCFVKIVNKYII